MQIDDLITELRRHWIVAMLAFLAVMGLGVAAAVLPEERYSSTAKVLVAPNLDEVQAGALEVVSGVLPTMETRIASDAFGAEAHERLEQHRDARVAVEVVVDPEAALIDIVAASPDPEAAAAWANAWAAHVVDNPPDTDLVDVELLDAAVPAPEPYTPVRAPILFGATLLALMAAVFAPLAAAWLQRRREGPRALIERSGVTVLGEIPAVKRRVAPGSASVERTVASGPPEVVEAFQAMRTNLEIMLLTAEPSPIAVTSTRPGEGKSTVTAHLGWALASVGHQVSVVDADLRRPNLHTLFDAPLEPGLSDAARIAASRLLRTVGLPNLALIAAGAPDRHPAEVMRDNLPLLMEQVMGADRMVLIDCPPLAGIAESSMIVTMTRRVILVIDAKTDQTEVQRSLARLYELGAEVVGVVVNRSRRKRDTKVDYSFDPARVKRPEERRARPVAPPPAPTHTGGDARIDAVTNGHVVPAPIATPEPPLSVSPWDEGMPVDDGAPAPAFRREVDPHEQRVAESWSDDVWAEQVWGPGAGADEEAAPVEGRLEPEVRKDRSWQRADLLRDEDGDEDGERNGAPAEQRFPGARGSAPAPEPSDPHSTDLAVTAEHPVVPPRRRL